MRKLLAVFLTLFFVIGSSFTSMENAAAKKSYDEGMKHLQAKNFVEAIAAFTDAVTERPNYKEAYFQRAIAKERLASSVGYQSTEPCQDFAQALNLGEIRSVPMLKKYCMNECYNMNNAFFQPELVFCVDFSNKVLTEMPNDAYNKLVYVTKMNLFNNRFVDIPAGFIDFNLLIELDMSSNRLTKVNNMIGSMKYLEELKLNKNYIKHVDFAIGDLKHLQKLHLKRNKLDKFPEPFLKLSNLEFLDLSDNQITVLPDNIGQLKSLKTLILRGNEIPKKEQKRVKKELPGCEVYFTE